jgi:hypothetical protein
LLLAGAGSLLARDDHAAADPAFLDFQAFFVVTDAGFLAFAHALAGAARELDVLHTLVICPYLDIQPT